MASAPVVQPKKLSLFEEMNRISVEDEEVIFQLLEEIDALELDAVGFRWASEATQSNQDRTLRNYVMYLQLFKIIPPDATDREIDQGAFPEDHDKAYSQLRK
jgi:hypothetical protein